MQASELPRQARDIAQTIQSWADQEGIDCEFDRTGSGHVAALITIGDETRKSFFSSTPSDRRAAKNALSQTKHIARQMGWTPQESTMEMPTQVLEKFNMQPDAEKCLLKQLKIEIPVKPKDWNTAGHQYPGMARARNKGMLEAREKDLSYDEISELIKPYGWDMTPAVVQASISSYRKSRKDSKRPNKSPDQPLPTAKDSRVSSIDDLMKAIRPFVEDYVERRCSELQAKADKWDAIKDLVSGA